MANFKRKKPKTYTVVDGVGGRKCYCCVWRIKRSNNVAHFKSARDQRKLDAAAAALKEEF